MSITRMLTRMCAVAALRGQTWADDRVFDSDNTPLSQALMLNEGAKPYIVVYTDVDNRVDDDGGGTEVYGRKREMSLVLEIGVASKIEGKEGSTEIKIPLTDEGMELALDMVEDQAIGALLGSPQNHWCEMLKDFLICVDRVSGQRGAGADKDRRWAARQLTLTCDVISDLPPGVPVPAEHPIIKFIEVSRLHPESEMEHAAEICAALANRTAAPQWEQVQAWLGARRIGLRAIGQAPLAAELDVMATMHGADLTDKHGEAPILRKISHDDMQMEGDEDVGLIDEFSISTNVITIKSKDNKDKVVLDGENP